MNHEEAYEMAVNELKQKGYYVERRYVTRHYCNNYIYKYNSDTDRFENIDIDIMYDDFKEVYLNQIRNYNMVDSVDSDEIADCLPDYKDVEGKFNTYKRYQQAKSNDNINFNDLMNEINKFLKINDDKKDSTITYITNVAEKDIFHLINNNIFIDGSRNLQNRFNLYQWDNGNKKFVLITGANISEAINIEEDFDKNWFLNYLPHMKFWDKRNILIELTDVGNLIYKFNTYYRTKQELKDYKDGFDEMSKIIGNFKM